MPEVRIEPYTRKTFPVDYSSGSRDLWKRFCKEYPEIKITYKEYKSIIYNYNYTLRDYMLETGESVKLPRGFGLVAINKWKPKRYINVNGKEVINLPVDWVKSRKAGKKIYNLNSHTDGFRYKWKWFMRTARLPISDIWLFIPTRKTSRLLAYYLKLPDSQYRQLYKNWSKNK